LRLSKWSFHVQFAVHQANQRVLEEVRSFFTDFSTAFVDISANS
jgi:hypothetical protein